MDYLFGVNNVFVLLCDIVLVNCYIDCVDVVDEMLALRRA